uniref:Uncharacterized protein n=1 Tax=Fagus sylvatica TaxID=28930 RepID=A0A2N9IYR0_FAGSY
MATTIDFVLRSRRGQLGLTSEVGLTSAGSFGGSRIGRGSRSGSGCGYGSCVRSRRVDLGAKFRRKYHQILSDGRYGADEETRGGGEMNGAASVFCDNPFVLSGVFRDTIRLFCLVSSVTIRLFRLVFSVTIVWCLL